MNKLLVFIKKRKRFISFSILRIVTMCLSLITNIFIVRELSVEDFGMFSVALMMVGLLTTFGFSWSSSSILYYGSKEKEKYGSINKTFWSRNIIIFISLIITTVGFMIFRNQINDYIGLNIWFLLLIWLYVSVLENYLNQYFLAVNKQIYSSLISITAKLIYINLIIFVSYDVNTLIILYIVSHASVILFILGINKKDIGKFEFDKSWFKEVLNFSLWQLFGFSGLYLINFGDIAVIKYFMTDKDVGIYNGAYQLFNAIAGFSFVISSFYAANVSSYFTRHDGKSIHQFFYKERFYIIGLSIFAHLVVIIFSKPIILTLYGDSYNNSIIIFNILMIGSLIRYMAVFYTLYYNTNRKYKVLQFINIIRAVINILLSIILIQFFGLLGTAIGTTLAILVTFLYSIYYCENRIKKFI
ncbi:lipopolysaccharide biosynthesis protein [Halobacillus sp. H74]|uniref:lipopolysaccharide biosynthesis protein n=1 Tax=Halobacillus sp. H74 TaxID=3457436 RepID=UPI003FCE8C4D